MENLTKTQLIFLVILVSFVTALFTGIVTATLVSQSPVPVAQTINHIIEKVIPGESTDQKTETPAAPVPSPVADRDDSIIKIVQDVSPAVVSVIATKDVPIIEQYYVNPFGGQSDLFSQLIPPELMPNFQVPQYQQKGTENKEVSSGSGFFISADGLIATNKHVVSDKAATYWVVMNDGRKTKAKVVAIDPLQDVAIIKLDTATSSAPVKYNFIPLGDSDGLKVGQSVIAIGNTLGEFQNTVSVGVISGLYRNIVASDISSGDEILQGLIQTDAAINPGNSGGPLLDLKGYAIGINTAVAQGAENVGFSQPINLVKKDLADIKDFGKIQYAYLGVRYQLINSQVKDEKKLSVDYGALLTKGDKGEAAVIANSPAAKAGLKEGDIILEFGGVKITQTSTLAGLINRHRAGDKVPLKVLRSGQTLDMQVTLEGRPENL